MYPYPYNSFWGWMAGMMIVGMIIVVVVGFLLYYWLRPRGAYYRAREDPFEIAKMRLARGEITAAEFEEIKKRITI